jgi:hypothetical protein
MEDSRGERRGRGEQEETSFSPRSPRLCANTGPRGFWLRLAALRLRAKRLFFVLDRPFTEECRYGKDSIEICGGTGILLWFA